MHTAISKLPELGLLADRLGSALRATGDARGDVCVVNREPAATASTFPAEIITCTMAGGSQARIYCKYTGDYRHDDHDHRRGLAYEAVVYSQVLRPLRLGTPKFYGAYKDLTTGETWLFLEYLDKALPVNHAQNPTALLARAARWIAEFHTLNARRIGTSSLSFLEDYDSAYYRRWSQRTAVFARDLYARYPWLTTVCQHYEHLVDVLAQCPRTVIHGEYESDNLLYASGLLSPIDWESAAIAAGEIDLARLTWGWPSEAAQACELEYQRNQRTQEGAGVQQRLAVARLYLLFRFLGDRPEWTLADSSRELFAELHTLADALGLVG